VREIVVRHEREEVAMAAHGKELRGLDGAARSSVDSGRFGRMFRSLHPAHHGDLALHELAETMIAGETDDKPITEAEPEDENPTITAGFTYFGQFVDHDITFDPVSSLTALNDPDALKDFRTPRLDLDSVYGRGNADQPYLYQHDNPNKLLLGPERQPPSVVGSRPDLPRNSEHVALVGDPRNDENIIVSQLQSLFLRFHNRVVDVVPAGTGSSDVFAQAQRLVRWHYQWLVVHEFLPRIVGDELLTELLPTDGSPPRLRFYEPKSEAFMPVEFSVAAYRYGHSMVRPSYSLSADVQQGTDTTKHRVPIFSDNPDLRSNLNGFRELPDIWGLDWGFFFPGLPQPPVNNPGTGSPYAPDPALPLLVPQPSYRIDTLLVDPLKMLPGPPVPAGPDVAPTRSLAERNLQRGRILGLPSGQAVARRLGITPLTDDVLWEHEDAARKAARQHVYNAFVEFRHSAPLWFYILREAELQRRTNAVDDTELGGHHLGPVGGRIVAEVLIGLLWADHHSYLYQDPLWTPDERIAPNSGRFTFADLVTFTDS
jgi:hypothetical protein